ncbi:MAG: plasmid pRiA4b ORF-3 family protein [Treponema sp.]|nr:plasmid pRiA4b ORF-3 family protein [Treponema sp.]
MTPMQEDALYDFLENVTEPFTLEDVTAFVYMLEPKRNARMAMEIAALIDSRNIAFRLDKRQWVSRRGCFEPVRFVINPSRLELLNGILIPGHRCIPFANPLLMPQEYKFFWKGSVIPGTTTEGAPEDFYPFYCIFGEEYAPQYVARDNPENESAFNCDPYEDPPEVSIHTLDMRNIYRETSFVPGDHFVAHNLDWKEGRFELEKVGKDEWSQTDLYHWFEAAEGGFEDSFALLGPGASTEEQIAYAYWYGGKRMREVPAYSLEDFLYEKTDRIETAPYGIETRFWFAGKEIPDNKGLAGLTVPPDRTVVEDMLVKRNVPISEYVILAYVRDALFRNEKDIDRAIDRVVPPVIHLEEAEWDMLADYISDAMEELGEHYSLFSDQSIGPIRQRVAELHTAVIDLAARLQKGEIDSSWLPKHVFIVLSQIQGHAASLLEDLDTDKAPPEPELEAMDNSLDSMIETYGDIKELIDDAMDNFRRNNLMVIRRGRDKAAEGAWWSIQISVSGTEIWRRVLVPGGCTLEELHLLIQTCLDWKNSYRYRFSHKNSNDGDVKDLDGKTRVRALCDGGITELLYEYGTKWDTKVIILSPYQPGKNEVIRCTAGAGAAPPEIIGGPLRFRKILAAMENGSDMEKQAALHELGPDFVPGLFDMERCNRNLSVVYSVENDR